MANDKITNVTDATLEAEILKADKPVLVDFWATWCGPCRAMAPIIDEIAEDRSDIKVCKIDVDENPQASTQYGIMSIPCFMVFNNGEVVSQRVGTTGKAEMLDFIDTAIA